MDGRSSQSWHLEGADFVQENGPELPEFKTKLFVRAATR